MLINHMGIIIKTLIKITSSKSEKPTKKMRNFFPQIKDVKVFMGSQQFFGNLIGKMTVEIVIWRCWQESLKK